MKAITKLKGKPEITRFKGLGEISPDEFKHFIRRRYQAEPVMLDKAMSIDQLLQFYMGKALKTAKDSLSTTLKSRRLGSRVENIDLQ